MLSLQTDRWADYNHTDRQVDTCTDIDRCTDRHADGQMNKCTDRHRQIYTDIQVDRLWVDKAYVQTQTV